MLLEMRAALQALLSFSSLLRGRHVLLRMDNKVCQQAGGHQKQVHVAGGPSCSRVGTSEPVKPKGNLCSWSPECAGRLAEQEFHLQPRVASEPTGLRPHIPDLGFTRDRPGGNPRECEMPEIPIKNTIPFGGGGELSPAPLELPAGIHLPSNSSHSEVSPETQGVIDTGGGSDSLLAKEAMVYHSDAAEYGRSPAPSVVARPTLPRSSSSPEPGEATFDGLETERARYLEQGCSQRVADTLLQARRPTTNNTYRRVWEKFTAFAQQQGWNPSTPWVSQVLEFLQLGLEKGLRSSTLKVQVSALSALTGVRWAQDPLVVQFQRACLKLRPPRKPSFPVWDLSVVLEALSEDPFFPNENISLWDLTLKVSFLIAITSAKRVSEMQALMASDPYLIVLPDRLVLKPSDQFIPKVSSSFHFNQEINLPALSTEQGDPHPLDVKGNVLEYLSATRSIRKTESLLIIPHGFKRGQAASSRTIASWLVKTIKKAYSLSNHQVPEGLRAHSTRAVATSWAAYCRVSAEKICRAATWSSRSTFMSHYKVDSACLSTVDLGRSVI